MGEPIKVGDLVMIVRLKACGHGQLGMPFIVQSLDKSPSGYIRCCECSARHPVRLAARIAKGTHINITRLIKIDPPANANTTDQPEELTA